MTDILALIDGALEDDGDAMRWSPDPPRVICDYGKPLWPIGVTSDGTGVPVTQSLSVSRPDEFFVIALACINGKWVQLGDWTVAAGPFASRPLAVNGHEYRRRQLARRKRRR